MKIILDAKAPKDFIWESHSMALVPPERSGVDNYIEIVQPDKKHKVPHIKVSTTKKPLFDKKSCYAISISELPTIIAAPKNLTISSKSLFKIQKFIILNRQNLLDYYHLKNADTLDVLSKLIPVKD